MVEQRFRALRVKETADGSIQQSVEEQALEDLPPHEVLVRVAWSSLNYKDALSATGHRGITRRYPHTPGIDGAGTVIAGFQEGSEVIITGHDLGMNTFGGWAGYVRVPANWLVPLPNGLSLREAMIYGTAGFTAALAVTRLRQAGLPEGDEVLVTGASGGVGSVAVALLAKLGYRVIAVSGKGSSRDWLLSLGAAEVVGREALADDPSRPLFKGRWAGAVDTVGGTMLAAALKGTRYGGAVAACGLAASPELSLTVYPFILRGVNLLGIDSVECPQGDRLTVWQNLAGMWRPAGLASLAIEVCLDDLPHYVAKILSGGIQGRVIVDPWRINQ